MSKRTLIVDSTQIQAFLECPQYWAYNYRQHLAPRQVELKDVMMQGSYGHKLLEIYYKNRASGLQMKESLDGAISFDIDSETNCKCGHAEQWHKDLDIGGRSLPICSQCTGTPNYSHPFDPQPFPLSQPLRLQVIDKVRMYVMTNSINDFQAHSPSTVEVGFSEPIYEDCEHLFILEGKIDLLGLLGTQEVIVDHKFQSRAHTLYKKAVQFRNYSMVSGRLYMLINYIRFARTTEKPFERALVSFSQEEHKWWRGELVKIYKSMLHHLDNSSASGLYGPDSHNWGHCKGDWGRPCEYSTLCEERGNERVKLVLIENNFTKKEEWRPW